MNNKLEDECVLVPANINDIKKIVELRITLWKQAGKIVSEKEEEDLTLYNINYHQSKLEQDSMIIPMIVKKDTKDILAIGIGVITEKPPVNYENLGKEFYIYNVYTVDKYRNNGFAKKIINNILEFMKKKNIKKGFLISNKDSFKLYEQIGFRKNDYYQEINI